MLALGETLPAIRKLLGHSNIATTERYAQLARGTIHGAAERIAGRVAAGILLGLSTAPRLIGVRLVDLHCSFAPQALPREALPIIGRLLGRCHFETTA